MTLTNTGTSFLTVSGITLTGSNASDFLTPNTCGSTVPSGASCTISVTFKPTIVGAESASVNIAGNQPGSPSTLSLSGTGAAAVASGGLVITPSAAFAGENGTVTLTASRR